MMRWTAKRNKALHRRCKRTHHTMSLAVIRDIRRCLFHTRRLNRLICGHDMLIHFQCAFDSLDNVTKRKLVEGYAKKLNMERYFNSIDPLLIPDRTYAELKSLFK